MSSTVQSIKLDQVFATREDLKHAIKKYAIQNNFETRTTRVDSRRYQIKCKAEDCPWLLHARPLGDSAQWRVEQLNPSHSCIGLTHTGNSAASADFLAREILEQVRLQPDLKPTNIVKDIHRIYGVEVPYQRAHAAKADALNLINGTHEESFAKLPEYCEQLLAANPGSSVMYEKTDTNQFHRFFLCFDASAKGFASCKPLLGLDGTSLKSRYQGMLLTATAMDANGQLFPLAFGVTDIEDDDNWLWFLQKLREVIYPIIPAIIEKRHALSFLSDRQKGLKRAVIEIFPLAAHGYCLKHLEKNLKVTYKNKDLVSLLWKAASSKTPSEFNATMEDFRKISQAAYQWLKEHTEPCHWVDCFFEGRRYGHYTSNIAESLNAWLLPAREQPLLPMIETIREKLMTWFNKRRTEAAELSDDSYAPKVSLNLLKLVMRVDFEEHS
jgi:hypothetical protein